MRIIKIPKEELKMILEVALGIPEGSLTRALKKQEIIQKWRIVLC